MRTAILRLARQYGVDRLKPLAREHRRDLLEIVGERYDHSATLITSHIPVDQWHALIDELTLADAILDRLLHHSQVVTIRGDSYRLREKRRAGLVKAGNLDDQAVR